MNANDLILIKSSEFISLIYSVLSIVVVIVSQIVSHKAIFNMNTLSSVNTHLQNVNERPLSHCECRMKQNDIWDERADALRPLNVLKR